MYIVLPSYATNDSAMESTALQIISSCMRRVKILNNVFEYKIDFCRLYALLIAIWLNYMQYRYIAACTCTHRTYNLRKLNEHRKVKSKYRVSTHALLGDADGLKLSNNTQFQLIRYQLPKHI